MEHMLKVPYIQGIEILLNNPKLVMSKVNSDDMNGYSSLYFDEITKELKESYYVYNDCDTHLDGFVHNNHTINLKNDFLYLDGSAKENVLFYTMIKWVIELSWKNIIEIFEGRFQTKHKDEIIKYLLDIYPITFDGTELDKLGISKEDFDVLEDILHKYSRNLNS